MTIEKYFRRPNLVVFLFLLPIVLCIYGDTIGHPFMMEDERLFALWARPLDLSAILACFDPFQKLLVYYRPVANVLYLLLNHLSAGDPLVCRLWILALFTVFIWLVYVLTKGLFKSTAVALMTALGFALHPINGFYVNYITASSILIWGTMMMAALVCHRTFIETKRPLWMGLSVLFSFLALGSHEMAGLLPAFVFLVNVLNGEAFKRSCARAACYALVVALWHLPRVLFVSSGEDVPGMMLRGASWMGLHPGNVLPSFADMIGWYLKQLFWPTQVLFMKTVWPPKDDLLMLNAAIVVFLILAGFLILRCRRRDVTYSLLWFACGLAALPAAAFISPAQGLTIEPHWFMIGSLGFFWMCALGIQEARQKIKPLLWAVGLGCLILFWGAFAKINNARWESQRSYCLYWLNLEPGQQFPSFWMGLDELKRGNLKTAEIFFKQSLTGWYIDWETFINLGAIALQDQRFDEAVSWSQKALTLNPSAAEAYNNLGAVYYQQGKKDAAREHFKKALAADRNFLKAAENLSFMEQGE